MKLMIWLGLGVGSGLGAWLGSLADNGNMLGAGGLIGSTVGGLLGIWAGYKFAQYYL